MGLDVLDWIAIGMYFALLLAVAWWVILKGRDTADDYFLAGRNLGCGSSVPPSLRRTSVPST